MRLLLKDLPAEVHYLMTLFRAVKKTSKLLLMVISMQLTGVKIL